MIVEEAAKVGTQPLGQRVALGGERRAEATEAAFDPLQVELGISEDARHSVVALLLDGGESARVARGIAFEQRHGEIGLGREMMMNGRLADADPVGEVGIAEARIAASAHKRLGLGKKHRAGIVRLHGDRVGPRLPR